MIENRERKKRGHQNERKTRQNIPHFADSIKIFEISSQSGKIDFNILFCHILEMMEVKKMKLRKRFESRRAGKNFY